MILRCGDQGVLDAPEHFLIADALAAHVIAVLFEDVAHFVVEPVFSAEFFGDDAGNELGDSLWIDSLRTPGDSFRTIWRER